MSATPAVPADDTATPPDLSTTFRALDAAGVEWCLLRGETDLGGGGDVDVLVASDDEAVFARVVRETGFVRLPSWGYATHSFFLRPAQRFDGWSKLDVVTELAFGPAFELRTDAARACLARRTLVGDLWVLDPDDAFWALLLHRLLDKGSIDERSAVRLRQLQRDATGDGPLARAVAAVAPAAWQPSMILGAVERDELAALERHAGPTLARAWTRRSPIGVRWRVLAERAWRAFAKLATVRRRPGLAVAVLGPDGSGKSTLADGLRDSFPLAVRSMYLAPFPAKAGAAPGPRGLGFTRRLLRLWRGWLVGRAHVARGRLVIFDRYPFDARVAPRRPLRLTGRLRRWIVGRSCPAPELVFVLDVPGATAHARKGELNPATLESERLMFRQLGSRLRRSVVLDATRSKEDIRRDAAEIVWRTWVRRWRTR